MRGLRGVPIEKRMEYYNKALKLREERKWGAIKISKKLAISMNTVGKWLYRGVLPFREREYPPIQVTNRLKGYLDGLLLGDGSINQKAYYRQSFGLNQEEWALKIKNDLGEFGISSSIKGPYRRQKIELISRIHPIFKDFRERWYKNGRKIIPRDINLSPITIVNWYLSDGKLDKDDMIILYTESFSKEDVEWLSSCLNKATGIVSYPHKNERKHWIIKVRAAESEIFLNYIKESKIRCFNYKFDLKCKHYRKKWLQEEDEELKRTYGGIRVKLIAKRLKRSLNSIYHRANKLGLKCFTTRLGENG